ncbi:hypothetical protein EVG20_g9433, partial [Dentipellis fragilis]
WESDTIVVAANSTTIPHLPDPQSQPISHADGLWAWITLPLDDDSPLYRMPTRADLHPHPYIPNHHVLSESFLTQLQALWTNIRSRFMSVASLAARSEGLSHVIIPWEATRRLSITLVRLHLAASTWTDIVESVRTAQRCILEFRAFFTYIEDWTASLGKTPLPKIFRQPTRGVITNDINLYCDFTRLGVAVFIELPKADWETLPRSKQVAKTTLREHHALSILPHLSIPPTKHRKEIWHYPPAVSDMVSFERAARGYAPRVDDKSLSPSTMEIMRHHSIRAPIESRKLNTEARRSKNMAEAPSWVPKLQPEWSYAGLPTHRSRYNGTLSRPWDFHLPPIHLFWGADSRNQKIFFFHWECIEPIWMLGHIGDSDTNVLSRQVLPTSDWRLYLGDTYWKRNWPRHPHSSTTFHPPYDTVRFWTVGCPVLFGPQNCDVDELDIVPRLRCGCPFSIDLASKPELQAWSIYKLNMAHVYWDFVLNDEMQCNSRGVQQTVARRNLRDSIWSSGPYPSQVGNHEYPFQSRDQSTRRQWFALLAQIIRDWKDFPEECRHIDFSHMDNTEYFSIEIKLTTFYTESFLFSYGYPPARPMSRPDFTLPACPNHCHE